MKIAGKCPPEPDELEAAGKRGFDQVELYIEREHLDNFYQTLRRIRNADVEAISVHTPHVHIKDQKAYFLLAEKLANELDAFLVFHSQYMHHVHIPQLEELELEPPYGYENNPGASKRHLEENILNQGYPMVLDTAHFFMSDPESYVEGMRDLIESYTNQIGLIHICDSTVTEDGLAFESGEMDMEAVSRMIEASSFDGILVMEVMPEHQKDAMEKWEWYTS
ncbi:MAG: sugar phosphate isomerase/epimerase family protein [Candidatus Nanohaloarchaea archaeon]